MSSLRKCFLNCMQKLHNPIPLPHNKAIVIGRSELTGIKNPSLSKNQVKLVADAKSCTVQIVPLGANPSGVNGFRLMQHKEYTLHHKDRLELLLDQYIYEIVFDPPPEQETESSKGAKRMLDNEEPEENMKKPKCECSIIFGWEEIDNKKLLIYTAKDVKSSNKIASFDLDGTLATPKSGLRFPKDADDWKFLFPHVPQKLRELHTDGYKIVIFTNQKGISLGKTKDGDFRKKIETIINTLNIPIQVFISTGNGIYRKPAPGMWDALLEKNDGIEIDSENSFYCGDAAGREKNWAPKMKKDHSVADRLFALNIGIPFKTPEEFFHGARTVAHTLPVFDPRNIIDDGPLLIPEDSSITSDEQELIVFVGCPGSGKSYICKTHLVPNGYVHINRDLLGSWQKCVTAAENALKMKQSVVIDNTNPDKESRKRYVTLAKKCGVVCRCFVMNTSVHQSKHNNLFREITDSSHQVINDIIINSYKKNFVEPKLTEGFNEIVQINCVPKFENPEHEKLYHMYLLDK